MARGWSGASVRPDGSVLVGPVTIPDPRVGLIRELLLDLSRPSVCLVLGAGASYGVVPMTAKEISAIAWKMLQARGSAEVLSSEERKQLAYHAEVKFLTGLLQSMPTGSWDRIILDALNQGRAAVILNDVFSPQGDVPPALVRIYDFIENRAGVIVSFNYDRIDEQQARFKVIAPHGRHPKLLSDPIAGSTVREMVDNFDLIVCTDWYLPFPEDERVCYRPAYQEMLHAWRRARCVVFVGYAFGGGADALSFEDFGRNLNPAARVHVLCPRPDNADLCKQIAHILTGRGPGFQVFGQPFRWRAFTEALLEVLGAIRASHVRSGIGKEMEIAIAHDRL